MFLSGAMIWGTVRLNPIASIDDTMNINAPTLTMTVNISIVLSLVEDVLASGSHRMPVPPS
jgi:hypothetical protein